MSFSAARHGPRARCAPLLPVSGALAKLRSEKMPLVPVTMRLLPVSGALAKLRPEKMPLVPVMPSLRRSLLCPRPLAAVAP